MALVYITYYYNKLFNILKILLTNKSENVIADKIIQGIVLQV